jgi:hypothetical protein
MAIDLTSLHPVDTTSTRQWYVSSGSLGRCSLRLPHAYAYLGLMCAVEQGRKRFP